MTISGDVPEVGFWLKWTVITVAVFPVAVLAGFIAGSTVHALFGFAEAEPGSFLSNPFVYMAFGTVFGAVMSLVQWLLLRPVLPISALWILACSAGFLVGEGVTGLVLWRLGILRVSYGVIQGGPPLPEAVIIAFCGAWIGLFQWRVLQRHVNGAAWWIPASSLAWGLGSLVMLRLVLVPLGPVVLGVITAVALGRLLKRTDQPSF